jgi:carbon monoxide dehydrogenase subunit G
MRRVLAVAVLVVLAAVAAAVRLGATRGPSARVERARLVAAPPGAVLAELADLKQWAAWSPFEGDPAVRRVYGGPPAGPGASAYWSDRRGEAGRLTVVGASADGLDLELERRGWPSADLELRLAPAPGGTRVTWVHVAEPDLRVRARAFLGLPHPVAPLLEQGLARLAATLEARPRVETFRVERSARLRAAPGAVLARLADVRSFPDWSPWEEAGRPVRRSFGGPRDGVGASVYWSEGERPEAGGRVTVTKASAAGVELELELRGASSDHALAVAPDGGGARVTWAMSGEVAPGARAPTAESLAGDLDRGLARLRALVDGDVGP